MTTPSWHPPQARRPDALALSGGGLRAALFQQGGVLALAMRNELTCVRKVGAISGGTLAALALRHAYAEVEQLPQPEAGWREEDRQRTIAMHAQICLSRLATRNIRMRALLSWKSVASAVLFGSLNLTRRFAEDINTILDRTPKAEKEPFELKIGLHRLNKRTAAHVTVRPESDVGVLAAAAMTIPGLMESLVVEKLGPVCDGGVDDKTALDLLTIAGEDLDVLVLDASTGLLIDEGRMVSPRDSLLLLLERDSETLRDVRLKQNDVLGWASLRDSHSKPGGLNQVLFAHLRNARTDLNHFSAVEEVALGAAGFVMTLQARGENRAWILCKAAELARTKLPSRNGLRPYPMGQLFEHVCSALLPPEEMPQVEQSPAMSSEQETISRNLSLVLEKSSRAVGHDIRSGHPFFFVVGLLASAWAFVVALSILIPLVTLFWVGLLHAAKLTQTSPVTMFSVLWAALGLTATLVAFRWARAPGTDFSIFRLLLAIVLLPALVPMVLTARFTVLMVHEGEGVWTLRHSQSTLGRLRGLLSTRDIPKPSGAKRFGLIAAQFTLFAIGVLNPWFFAFCIAPSWTNAMWHFDAMGKVGWVFTHVPLQPATLALLALELLTAALFVSWSFTKRASSSLVSKRKVV